MNILSIINPNSGTKDSIEVYNKCKPKIIDKGYIVDEIITTHHMHAYDEIKNISSNIDQIILFGGDGTAHEVVNGLIRFNKQIPIGIVPCGSGNSIMHDLNQLDYTCAIETILRNKKRDIDILEVKCKQQTLYAANIVGWGMVTDIGVSAEKYRWLGTSRYTLMSVVEVFKYNKRPAKLSIDGEVINESFLFVMASNTIHTGKGMKISPKAKIDDGLMDVVVVKDGPSRLKLLNLLPKIFDGTHINEKEVLYIQAKEIQLITEEEVLNIDGELKGSTPISIRVLPNKIKILN
tara:strand:- start:2688 stop:3563 length:876 start_codon:yes stop_codon:yes gene_type:complete